MENTRETRVNHVASESHQNGYDDFKRCRRGLHGYKKLSAFEYLCMFVGMTVVMIAVLWTGVFLIDKFLTLITPAVEWLINLMYGKLMYLTLGIAGVSFIALVALPTKEND